MRSTIVTLLAAVLAWSGLGTAGILVPSAHADTPGGQLVSATPAAGTPHVLDGQVYSVTQVGNTILLGGTFSKARNDSGDTAVVTRTNLLAFDATTGKLVPGFRPDPNGLVRTIVPAGDGQTVYVVGAFTSIGGVARQRVARIRVSDGGVVTAFDPGSVKGQVRDAALKGGRLWIGGAFTHVGGRAQKALATLNPTTGAVTTYMSLAVDGIHNSGVTQVLKLDVTPDGSRLVAVGNFDTLAGVRSHQLLQLDLRGATAAPGPWRTGFYTTPCHQAFDTYMRDVDFAPDGSYFVVVTTGAYGGAGVACDSVARFETASTGADVRPSWVDNSGGDTTYAVEATPGVVYVGGHHRWWNNPFAGDRAGPGAVSREGIAALDPVNGLPLSWNPGRDKGVGVFDFLLTTQGLWVTSDTDRIAGYYKARVARMPAGGVSYPAQRTPTLPGDVYVGGPGVNAPARSATLYRVDERGVASRTAAAEASALPREVFDTDLRAGSDDAGRTWSFPVRRGTPVTVRLRLARTAGAPATVRSFREVSTGEVRVDPVALAAGRQVTGIEVEQADSPALAAGTLTRRQLSDDSVGALRSAPDGGLDWATTRGAFMLNGSLYVAHDDGSFDRRTFDGTTYGAPTPVNAADQLVTLEDWRADVRAATGMFFDNGRIYFTRADSDQLFYRYFSPQSGVVGAQRLVASGAVAGFSPQAVRGMFVTPSALYWASSDGSLRKTGWSRQAASGVPVAGATQVVSGPGVDGATWSADSLFVFQGPGGAGAVAPTASFTQSCSGLTCGFDAAASTAPGSSVASYDWSFGDGQVGSGVAPSHGYASAGTRTVSLTVTSANGLSSTTSRPVTVSDTAGATVSFVGANRSAANSTTHRVTVPATVRAGDTLLLYLTLNDSTVAPAAPAGWTALDAVSATGLVGRSWSRTATAADAGSVVTVTTPALAKSDLALHAYRGTGGVSRVAAHAAAVDQVSGTSHRAPTLSVAPGAWVVTQWIAKSSVDITWTTPSGAVRRTGVAGAGGGRLTSLGVDSGAAATGSSTGLTAQTSAAVSRTVMFTTVVGTG